MQDSPPGARATTRPAEAAPTEEPSTAELLKGLADDATTLVRQEILLARQELQEGLTATAKASALLVAAGVLGLYAFGFCSTPSARRSAGHPGSASPSSPWCC
jgi:hypothetical protein